MIYRDWVRNLGDEHIEPSPFYLSPKGSNYRGITDALTVPSKNHHGEVEGLIRPASSAIESIEGTTLSVTKAQDRLTDSTGGDWL